jgi:hypothetical protein
MPSRLVPEDFAVHAPELTEIPGEAAQARSRRGSESQCRVPDTRVTRNSVKALLAFRAA